MNKTTQATAQGRRSYQEDRYFAKKFEGEAFDGWLMGVADGHGGAWTSEHVAKRFPELFATHILGRPTRGVPDVMRRVYATLNDETKGWADGSTLSVCFIPEQNPGHFDGRNDPLYAYCAVLGDSPIIIGTAKKYDVSPEHNVRNNPKEVLAAVKRGGWCDGGYLFDKSKWDGPGLQMSRAFGDVELAKVLNRKPQVYRRRVYDFVLLGSDGLFDPGHENTEQEIKSVVEIVRGGGDAQALVDRALKVPTGDNVTAILWRK